jgi:hypothetical protein
MYTIYSNDNIAFELEQSDAGYPPGQKGMNLNTGAIWIRVKYSDKWYRSPHRSFAKNKDFIEQNTSNVVITRIAVENE